MDLNLIYHRYFVALYMSDHAISLRARVAHRLLADGFASRIALARIHGSEVTA